MTAAVGSDSICKIGRSPGEVIRYLGIFIVSHVCFRCSTDHAKRSFYRAANAIFAKVGLFLLCVSTVLVNKDDHKDA